MKNTTLSALKLGAAPMVLGLALVSTSAFAQTTPPTDEEAADSTIVVTGSLIRNPNLERSNPVNVTTADELELKQTNVAEQVLREIPGIVPSIGSAVNNGNGGASYVNLRGLGSNRNVVLLDGARIVPADLAGRVDLNNIPVALVDRVDVLTGGASTTYGADAVTGVVNFIIRRDFAGLELASSYQITEEGDGATFRTDLTMGANFDDGRGNAVVGIGYQKSDPVYQGARSFSLNNIGSFNGRASGSGTTSPTRASVPNVGNLQATADGQALVPYYQPFNFNPYNIFQTPFKRYNIFAQANYEVSDAVEVYTRGMFSKNTVETIIAPSGAFAIGVAIPLSNPFLSTSIRNTLCTSAGLNAAACALAGAAQDPTAPGYKEVTVSLGRRAVEAGPRISQYNTTVFDYRAGLRGGVTDTINWDISGAYGQSENLQTIKGYTLNSRWRQGIRSTANGCIDSSNGCVPVNPFGTLTPDMVNFLVAESTSFTRSSLAQARAMLTGDVGVTLPWASDAVSFALGSEYRKYKASQGSDTLSATGDLGGSGGPTPPIKGSFNVYEFIGEVVVPLIQDKPGFEDLTLEGGIRRSHYSVDAPGNPTFKTTTWKAGGSWTPGFGLKIRGNYARAVRAPNIGELFSPVSTGLTNLSDDPCATFNDLGQRIRPNPTGTLRDVCIAQGATAGTVDSIGQPTAGQANATGGGNLNLKPETSNSWTLGVVFQPDFVPGFNMSLDYYNIKVKGAVSSPTPDDAMSACFDALSTTNPACLVIRRDPLTGMLSGDSATTKGLFLASSNLGALSTDGFDLVMNYKRDLGFAKLGLNFVGNYTKSSKFQATPSGINRECVNLYSENCASIQPKYSWSLRTTLGIHNIDMSLLWRHINAVHYEDAPNAWSGAVSGFSGTYDFNHIKAYDWFDLSTRFNVSDNLSMTLTVQNLLDKKPPLVGSDIGSTSYNSGNTYPSTYDALGRRYGVQVKLKF